jgi:hypothetical protein
MVEKHMIPAIDVEGNKRMDWFFRQYVYGTGIPEYRLEWTTQDAGGGQWNLNGKVIQSDVPEGWVDVLTLYVQVAGNVSRLGMLSVRGRESNFSIKVPWKAEKLMLNYMDDTLAVIR